MKKVKAFSIILGVISLTFGLLKFISPFKDWYAAQIKTSGLPHSLYALGITGEIVIGISFLLPFIGQVNEKQKRRLLIFANISLTIMMISATVVHLIPDVPASVLPLKIKPPIIPLMFLFATIFNLLNVINKMNSNQNISKGKKTIYWATTIVIASAYFVTGIGNILPIAHIAHDMAHLGYPTYFLKILGTWKVLAAITILIPGISKIKEWVYSGMIFDLTGAALSRYAVGDNTVMIIIPIAISVLVTINYLLRHSIVNKAN